MQLRALVKVPVVLCSPLRPGKISEVVARLYLGRPPARPPSAGTPAGAPLLAPADASASVVEGAAFQIPYESNLND